jgi:hypothetical protein
VQPHQDVTASRVTDPQGKRLEGASIPSLSAKTRRVNKEQKIKAIEILNACLNEQEFTSNRLNIFLWLSDIKIEQRPSE